MRTLGFLPEPKVKSIFPDYSEGNSPYMEALGKTEKEAKKLEIPKAVKDEETFPGWKNDGMLISADKLGNMNMAYVGTKMGLPKIVFQNFLTKDKDDAFWVQYGIDLAEQGR